MTTQPAIHPAKHRRFTWGTAMTLVFIAWAVFIVQFIWRANTLDRELVADKPYEQGLAYQHQIEATQNATAYAANIRVSATSEGITLALPAQLVPIMQQAELHLQRPDRRADDIRLTLPVPATSVEIPVQALRHGHWRARLTWTANGKPCLYQTSLFVP